MSNYIETLSSIRNPVTGKTLTEEKRWVSESLNENKITITYNRDQISTEGKREIENAIVDSLSSKFSEDSILVKTISSEVENKTEAKTNSSEQAQLKVGHEQKMVKKSVPNVKNVIAVSSCKGGVGKSTVTVNLAYSLAKSGAKVGIVDADIYGPSMPILLGKRGQKPEATEDKKIKPIEVNGVKFISFGLFIGEDDPVIWRGPMLGGVLNQFLFDTSWGELDYLIIDLPPGTGDIQLSMVQNVEMAGVIVVSTPQTVAISDTRKGIKMFEQVKIPILGLVENMSYFVPPEDKDKKYFIFGEGGAKKAASDLGLEFLGEIPLEIDMRESADEGRPYMYSNKDESKVAFQSYMNLAKSVEAKLGSKKKGFFNKIFN